jgi:hypothetical protein
MIELQTSVKQDDTTRTRTPKPGYLNLSYVWLNQVLFKKKCRTPNLIRCTEHIIHSHVMKHLQQNNVLTDCQHGFRAKRSIETQLIVTIHDLTNTIQRSESTHVAVLDFSKAFDKVPHQSLLRKL